MTDPQQGCVCSFVVVGLRLEQFYGVLALLSIDKAVSSGLCCPVNCSVVIGT